MKENYTHIVLLLDRSGSMSMIKEDMDGGIASFLKKQKLEPGTCTITAAQFDSEYEIIHRMTPINDIETIKIEPRGVTALVDSMVRLIHEVGSDLYKLEESERPDRVLFLTITDGDENASVEFNNEDLAKLIKEQEDTYNWNFTYIGANQDAFSNSSKFGGKYSNSLNYVASPSGVTTMFSKVSDATSRFRGVSSSDLTADTFQYTEEEQKDL